MRGKKKNNPRERPLRAGIKAGVLTVSVGINTLAWCAENPPDGHDPVKVIDQARFAKDVLNELLSEQEDGTTPVHSMFDKVIEEAICQGGTGLDSDVEGAES